MQRYGWLRHDGASFGEHEVLDPINDLALSTTFVKRPGGDHGNSPIFFKLLTFDC